MASLVRFGEPLSGQSQKLFVMQAPLQFSIHSTPLRTGFQFTIYYWDLKLPVLSAGAFAILLTCEAKGQSLVFSRLSLVGGI